MAYQERPRLSGNKLAAYNHLTKKERRILVVGDLHEPFTHPDYLDFCKQTYSNYNCNQVIFIGDIIDSHGWSYHEHDPDGMSAGNELNLAIKKVAKWYKAFPVADVMIKNQKVNPAVTANDLNLGDESCILNRINECY